MTSCCEREGWGVQYEYGHYDYCYCTQTAFETTYLKKYTVRSTVGWVAPESGRQHR